MLFNSYIFIFAFFPLCLLGFYTLKKNHQTAVKIWLIGCSLWFYGYFNTKYLLIMIASILFNYMIFKLMLKNRWKKGWFICGIVGNLSVLFYFKYYDFFIENINHIFSTSLALKHILLPLGISFFTFQQISFLTDTYRNEIQNCSFVNYALFVSFFPQLIAGPIVTQDEMLPQFENIGRKIEAEEFAKGLSLFVLGLCKKVLIADTFGLAVDKGYGMIGELNSIDALLVMLFYTLQLYYDFSGYCDMAVGLGEMLGIQIPLNFKSPYKAPNIIDFWKRWHITLSRFFMKNIYIPLGGNRKGVARTYCNLLMVFFISGLWHGAGWNFVLWGMMHGILYCITRWVQKNRGGKKHFIPKAVGIAGTFLFVNAAWIFFRSPTISDAFALITRIFTGGLAAPSSANAECFNLKEFWYLLKVFHLTDFAWSPYIIMTVFTVVILWATFFTKNVHEIVADCKFRMGGAVVLAVLFVWCVVSLSGVSTFLYFNF